MRLNPTLKKISLHSLIYSMVPQAPRLLGLITLPIITQFLDDTDFGIRGVLMSYIGLFMGVKELGLSIMFDNAFFKRSLKWKLLWRFYHGIIIIWSLVYVGLLAGLVFLVIPKGAQDKTLQLILLICIPAALFSSTNTLGRKYFILSERPWKMVRLSSFQTVLVVFTNLFTIAYLKMGFLGWFVGDLVGSLALFCFFLVPVYGRLNLYPLFIMRWNWIKTTLKEGFHFIPHHYSTFLFSSSDRIVLDQMNVDMGEIGQYNLAGNFSRYFRGVSKGYSKAVRPTFFRLLSAKKDKEEAEAHEITVFTQKIFLMICFLASLWVKEVMDLLVSRPYVEQAYPYAVILLMSYAQKPLYTLVSIKLFSHGAAKHLWKITLATGLLNLILNLIFVPFYGVIVAPITTFIAMMVQGSIGFYLSAYQRIEFHKSSWIHWIPIFMIGLLLVYYLMDSGWLLKGGVTLLLLVYGYMLFYKNKDRLFTLDEG